MYIVEEGETLVLRLREPIEISRVQAITDHFAELFKRTGVRFVLLDSSLEPCAIQKK